MSEKLVSFQGYGQSSFGGEAAGTAVVEGAVWGGSESHAGHSKGRQVL